MTDLNLHVESALQHVYEVCMGWSALFPGPLACSNARAQGRAWERGYSHEMYENPQVYPMLSIGSFMQFS